MSDKLVRLYPTGKAFIDGVPAQVCDVTPARAAELLAYQPPAFTTEPPKEAGSGASAPKSEDK